MARVKQADKNYIAVLGKTFTVVEYLIERSDTQELVSFARISKELPFSRTTIHRILYSLVKIGYVEKAGISQYRLAAKFFFLTGPVVHFRRLQSVASSVMHSLLIRHGETVCLGALEGGEITLLDVHQSLSELRMVSVPGNHKPIHCTGLGKAILAFLPESEARVILDENPLVRRTPKTITRKTQLLQHLASVREQKVAFDLDETTTGVTCAAAPIFDPAGQVVAAISLSGPTARITPKLGVIKDDLQAATLLVSRMLAPLSKPESSSLKKYRERNSNGSRPPRA